MSSATEICAAQSDDEAWDYIRAHHDAFFWTDDEDHLDTWNRRHGSAAGGFLLEGEWRGKLQWFVYRGKVVRIPLRFDRDDRWLIIHTLAQVVRADCEFRFCKDSAHSSDQAFLALPAAEWAALESSFDAETIARRFLKLDPDFDVFLETSAPPASTESAAGWRTDGREHLEDSDPIPPRRWWEFWKPD